MVEKYVVPSELHLKKELISLRKARMLRDPETCSSLRSPLSSKSFAAYNLYYEDEVPDAPTRENISGMLPEIPPRIEKSRKKVYLYNWKNHSSKSSESGIKLDEDGKQPSVESCLEVNLSNPQREETLGDRFLLSAPNIYNGRNEDLGTTIQRRSGIRLKKSAISSRRARKHASNLKQLDIPSKSTRILSSVEQSDDIGQCSSEDEHHLPFDLLYKDSHHSPAHHHCFLDLDAQIGPDLPQYLEILEAANHRIPVLLHQLVLITGASVRNPVQLGHGAVLLLLKGMNLIN
ncbi:hypothetical protein KSP39_PZI020049 [Platanthera zijinensis]|uniref:Uncharacterized protein n=1 Tax=Platanthera zijinensis TaxID=2320716 RepID=A0AAP0FWV8_9ASPA